MPKGSEELTSARKDEIITACAKLYETMFFKDITLKDIAACTSFTRPSIYNYFHTKEEIFLALLQREYELWAEELDGLRPSGAADSRIEFAQKAARSLERRGRLLRLLATSLYDLEENSRIERLVDLKTAFGASIKALDCCLGRFCPDMSGEERGEFISLFLPLMNGIYPYTESTAKQREALGLANVHFECRSIYDIVFPITKKLLKAD